jgi:hypothetical protein
LLRNEVERPAIVGRDWNQHIAAPVPMARLRPPRRRTVSFSPLEPE